MFTIATNTLNVMFTCALNPGVLYKVSLGPLGKMHHLQCTDDRIILIIRGIEDLKVIKLIIYLFKGVSGVPVNLRKSYLFTSKFGHIPRINLVSTPNCSKDQLPITYLGVLILRQSPS